MKFSQMRPYLKDLQQNKFGSSNQANGGRSTPQNICNLNDETTQNFYQQRRKRASSVKQHTLLRKNVSYFQKVQQQSNRRQSDRFNDFSSSRQTSQRMDNSQVNQNIPFSDDKEKDKKLTVLDALSPNLKTRQRFYSLKKDENNPKKVAQQKEYQQQYQNIPCFGGNLTKSNSIACNVDSNINEYMKQYATKYQRLVDLGKFNQRQTQMNIIKKAPSFHPLTFKNQSHRVSQQNCQSKHFSPFGQSNRYQDIAQPIAQFNSISQINRTLKLVDQNQAPKHIQSIKTLTNNDQTIKRLQQMQYKLIQAEKKLKFQDKFIDSIQKMRKTIQKTEEQCNLKDLWQWIKKLPKQLKLRKRQDEL